MLDHAICRLIFKNLILCRFLKLTQLQSKAKSYENIKLICEKQPFIEDDRKKIKSSPNYSILRNIKNQHFQAVKTL